MARHKRKGTPLTWSIKIVGNVIVFLSTFQAKLLMMQGKRLNRN